MQDRTRNAATCGSHPVVVVKQRRCTVRACLSDQNRPWPITSRHRGRWYWTERGSEREGATMLQSGFKRAQMTANSSSTVVLGMATRFWLGRLASEPRKNEMRGGINVELQRRSAGPSHLLLNNAVTLEQKGQRCTALFSTLLV